MAAAPTRTRRPARPHTPTTAEQHAEWLGLLRPDGPFLTVPVLAAALPQGIDTVPGEIRDRLRQGWAEVQEAPDLLGPAWCDLILTELLRYPASARSDGAALPVEPAGGLRPDLVWSGPEPGGGQAPSLHVYRRPAGTPLTRARGDQPALAEQAAARCRDTGTPLALLTNGQHWVLVHARPREPAGTAVFDADLWGEEPVLLRAFATLLAAPRVLTPPTKADGGWSDSLAGLFARSAEELTQVTTTLGDQVLRAVELFVGELARLDRESGQALLDEVSDRDIYRGALTVLMRLVFLLYAEEQRLLPVADPLYAQAYAASTLYDQLDEVRGRYGDEIGDRRSAAWPRLLALFSAIHGGCEHPDLRIPAHGGSLFDPARFPWLADAAVTDRVVYQMLDALLWLRRGRSAAERLSYQSLNVEQIGHVYEGLLEFSCRRVDLPHVGLTGKREPELALVELEAAALEGEERLRGWLAEGCDLTTRQVEKARQASPSPEQLAALHAACDNDPGLAERVRPFWGLLRIDLRRQPTVFPAGSVLFTKVGDRRATGTHYTPRELAEEVVTHTLDPLCFDPGPAQGVTDPEAWRPKTADELLALKVLDPAMGSGAFLVSACRYLAGVLARAWERDGVPAEAAELAGTDGSHDDLLLAARRMVAARCLYGVDRDDMAVELAKLSLWLVTLAKGKPFGFLDHAFRCGDSLVGVVSTEQLAAFHLDPERGRLLNDRLSGAIDQRIDAVLAEMTELRQAIESSVVEDARQSADKAGKLQQADRVAGKLRLAADAVVAAALSTAGRPGNEYDDRLTSVADEVYAVLGDTATPKAEQELRTLLSDWLAGPRADPVHPLHWPLEFPEVMRHGGFHAVVGNPPFIGGQRLTGATGVDVREHLVGWIGGGQRGSADLCAYFLLRDLTVARQGRVGIIATNTIAQGDTREVGLDQATGHGWTVYRAVKSRKWPGTASLEVSLVWLGRAGEQERPHLDGRTVRAITPSLDPGSRVSGNPHRLAANAGQSFQGSNILGPFTLEPHYAQALIDKDPRNRDVLFPYLNGKDLSSRPDCSARRWVINFHDWPIERAQEYPDCFDIVEREVKPYRATNRDRRRREIWWRFTRPTTELYEAIAGLDRVLVIVQTSSTQIPVLVPNRQVFDQKLVVFSDATYADLCFRASAFQYWWTVRYSSTLEARIVYAPSDCCENLVAPTKTQRMNRAGARLDRHRRSVMLERELGLTKLYNLVHDRGVTDDDIQRLREVHVEIDEAAAEAYGWADLDLGHGFHDTRQAPRFTIAPEVQVEVLDLLLELNHDRYAEEVRQGLHTGRRGNTRKRTTSAATEDAPPPDPDALF
jgi:hypothetical protein